MKKKPQSPRDAALTLAAAVAVLGTSLGVAPQDILAAEPAPTRNTAPAKKPPGEMSKHVPGATQDKWKPGAGQYKEKPAVGQSKLKPGATQDKWKPGASQYKEQPGADQFKFKPGAIQDKH